MFFVDLWSQQNRWAFAPIKPEFRAYFDSLFNLLSWLSETGCMIDQIGLLVYTCACIWVSYLILEYIWVDWVFCIITLLLDLSVHVLLIRVSLILELIVDFSDFVDFCACYYSIPAYLSLIHHYKAVLKVSKRLDHKCLIISTCDK